MRYTASELIMISILGFLIVFIVLLSLALLTTLFGRLIPAMEGREKPLLPSDSHEVTGDSQGTVQEDEMEEVLAVLQSVLSEESGIASDEMIIKSIRRDEV